MHHLAQSLGVQIQSDEVDDTQKQEPAAKPTHSNDAVNTNASSASKEGDLEEISKEESQNKNNKDADRLRVLPYVVATGNGMVDQFQSWYFGIAFAFMFKFCVGMPDMLEFAERQRFRRDKDAPRMEPPMWVQVMSRRVEAQMQRDWHFGFVTWNYLFRSAINLSRSLYSYESVISDEGKKGITAEELEKGAVALCKALHGKYLDVNGKMQSVKGDITKIRHVPGLTAAAKRLLQNIEHTSRKIPGTQEVRRVMRFQIQGYRIRYGVPIFVTFSPDEGHNLLMVRLSRTRRNDPVFSNRRDEVGKKLSQRGIPKLDADCSDDVFLEIPFEDLLPSHAERRVAMARDSLASVDGFRVLVMAAFKYLFGINLCWNCPDCQNSSNDCEQIPCQDICGRSCFPEGLIVARAEAAFARSRRRSLQALFTLTVKRSSSVCINTHL